MSTPGLTCIYKTPYSSSLNICLELKINCGLPIMLVNHILVKLCRLQKRGNKWWFILCPFLLSKMLHSVSGAPDFVPCISIFCRLRELNKWNQEWDFIHEMCAFMNASIILSVKPQTWLRLCTVNLCNIFINININVINYTGTHLNNWECTDIQYSSLQ